MPALRKLLSTSVKQLCSTCDTCNPLGGLRHKSPGSAPTGGASLVPGYGKSVSSASCLHRRCRRSHLGLRAHPRQTGVSLWPLPVRQHECRGGCTGGARSGQLPCTTLPGRRHRLSADAFGVSLGGSVVGEVCRLDPRVRACLVMDAPMSNEVVKAGLRQPSMWITRDAASMRLERQRAGGWPEVEIQAHLTSMRAAYDGLSGAGYFVQVPGMFHSNFTDIPSWTPLASWLGVTGPIDAMRAHDMVNAYSLSFFDRHLLGGPARLLDGSASLYAEVLVETKRPPRSGAVRRCIVCRACETYSQAGGDFNASETGAVRNRRHPRRPGLRPSSSSRIDAATPAATPQSAHAKPVLQERCDTGPNCGELSGTSMVVMPPVMSCHATSSTSAGYMPRRMAVTPSKASRHLPLPSNGCAINLVLSAAWGQASPGRPAHADQLPGSRNPQPA